MRFLQILFLLLCFSNSRAQIPVGKWRSHQPYRHSSMVCAGNGRIYCAGQLSLFYYDLQDKSMHGISRVEGLSDAGIACINYNRSASKLVIVYQNGNIDILSDNGQVENISDLYRKIIVGDKTVFSVRTEGKYAYLSLGFGIMVVDLEKAEIRDTYYIGPLGSSVGVYSTISDGTSLFAMTENGVLKAALNTDLSDYNSWQKIPGLPGKKFTYSAKVGAYTFFYLPLEQNTKKDTVYRYHSSGQLKVIPVPEYRLENLQYDETSLLAITYNPSTFTRKVLVMDTNLVSQKELKGYNWLTIPKMICSYPGTSDYFIADDFCGLGVVKANDDKFSDAPNGPYVLNNFSFSYGQNRIIINTGGYNTITLNSNYAVQGLAEFKDNQWKTYDAYETGNFNSQFSDPLCSAIDPEDADHYFVGSFNSGLIEVKQKVLRYYTDSNSTLQNDPLKGKSQFSITGVAFDSFKNLWVLNSATNKGLSVKKADGTWKAFDIGTTNLVSSSVPRDVGKLIIDNAGQKWFIGIRTPFVGVFNDNGTIDDESDDRYKHLTLPFNSSFGAQSAQPSAIALDKEGNIWVGTNFGIGVFSNTSSALDDQSYSVQQIPIVQEGLTQYLLEAETVTALAVDPGNRKWVGTATGGLYLFSPDGTRQIAHYTKENSPLYSNAIICLEINQITGEVFIGTDNGVISYMGESNNPSENFESVKVFPNPVTPEYQGNITIDGLADNVNVKITDIAGHLVFETKALGGRATWNGLSITGSRVVSGIYLIYCSNEDGQKTFVGKIGVIH